MLGEIFKSCACFHLRKVQKWFSLINCVVMFMTDRLLAVDTMHALCSNTKIVKETMHKGKYHIIVDVYL